MSDVLGRVIGLDLGDARIGVAICDPDRRLALPLGTIHVGRPPGELIAVRDLAREHDADLVVLGLPLHLSGDEGDAAAKARAFAEGLAATGLRVELHDERLSTVEAERALRDAGVPGRDRRRSVDAAAATVILQSWLDGRR